MNAAELNQNQLVERYFELAPAPDREAYFALFSADAAVEDEGKERQGIDEIRAWRTEAPSVSYVLADIQELAGGRIAAVDISGDFPGSPVQLKFTFRFTDDGLISFLAIRS